MDPEKYTDDIIRAIELNIKLQRERTGTIRFDTVKNIIKQLKIAHYHLSGIAGFKPTPVHLVVDKSGRDRVSRRIYVNRIEQRQKKGELWIK